MRNSDRRSTPRIVDGQIKISYSTEADGRTALGRLAEAFGWLVDEEVVIPGWGRIDLVLRSNPDATPILVELKKNLSKPSEIRKAFQQADGYGRWWRHQHNEDAQSVLVGYQGDLRNVAPVAATYPEVMVLAGGVFMERLRTWNHDVEARTARAREQLASLESLLAVHRHAVDEMDAALTRTPQLRETDSA